MNIVKQKWSFFQETIPLVPKQLTKLYQFGLQTLALRRIESLKANARIIDLNWHTAKSKMCRLTRNVRFLTVFPKLLVNLGIINDKDIVAIDFSDFGNHLQILMFAKQTKKGRTVPLYFEVLKYPIEKDSQNTFIIRAIENFAGIVGFRPKLVFDRGFACPAIIEFLAKQRHKFIIRIKKGKAVKDNESKERFLAKDSSKHDLLVTAYRLKLRLIISGKTRGSEEPWYLITNDFRLSREKVVRLYYHRFEIEEFFRDAKRLLGLEHVNLRRETSLSITLWFVALGLWFLWKVEEELGRQTVKAQKMMGLSIIRYYLEQLQQEIILAAEGKLMLFKSG